MDILLVQPPLAILPEVQPPLGLCVLASHLVRSKHTVCILDLDLQAKSAAWGADHYIDTFKATLRERRPGVVGFTSMFNNSLHAERLIRAAKEVDTGVVTVAGGSHFGALPQQSLERIQELDFVIRGEGEIALCSLLSALDRGRPVQDIPGLCYRTPAGIMQNPGGPLLNLKEVNPTWSSLEGMLDLRDYIATIPSESPRKTIYTEAGRGCPFACSFCATAPFWERRYRVKAIDCIVGEMRYLHEQFGYDMFMLVHDLLTADRRFVDDFCDALFSARLPVEWTANHRADIELGALAAKMRGAGCLSVFMGIESASDHVQKDVHKGLTRNHTLSTVRSLMEVGISSTCSFIIGFPSETAADVSATLELAGQLKMMGAEPVQVHRLRRWPPAPLAALDLPSSFDLEALRLEYPSDTIPRWDIEMIRADPAFFMGYFTPASVAGSAFQLAQLELLFANLLSAFPVTTAALARIYRDQFVAAFYNALTEQGPVSRAALHSPSSALETLLPYLSRWIANDTSLEEWQRVLLTGALLYERVRISFMGQVEDGSVNAVAAGAGWSAFTIPIDIVELLRRLAAGSELSSDLCLDSYVVMARNGDGAVHGFALREQSMERLRKHDPRLLAILENHTVN